MSEEILPVIEVEDTPKTATYTYNENATRGVNSTEFYKNLVMMFFFSVIVVLQIFTFLTLRKMNSFPKQGGGIATLPQAMISLQQVLLSSIENEKIIFNELTKQQALGTQAPVQSIPAPVEASSTPQ